MPMLFVEGLTPDQCEKLRNADIAFESTKRGTVRGHHFCLEVIHKACGLLGLQVESSAATNDPEVFTVKLCSNTELILRDPTTPLLPGAPAPVSEVKRVIIASAYYRRKAIEAVISETLLSENAYQVHVLAGKPLPPSSDSRSFYIWNEATPQEPTKKQPLPKSLWDIPLGYTGDAFLPSYFGVVISCPKTGFPIAELIGNSLYLLSDLLKDISDSDLAILRKILAEVCLWTSSDTALRDEYHERNRNAYMQACVARVNDITKNLPQQVAADEEKVRKLQEELTLLVRSVNANKELLKSTEALRAAEYEKLGREYDALLRIPKVLRVDVTENKLLVFTDLLFCKNPTTENLHQIGRFRIEIDTGGKAGGVRWFNLTRRVNGVQDGMQAPHIYATGDACLGNFDTMIPKLIGDCEFAALAMLAIQFVESVNITDGAGKHLPKWPIAIRQPKEEK